MSLRQLTTLRFLPLAILLAAPGLLSGPATAQEAPAQGGGNQVQARLDQGIQLFKDGEFEAATQAFSEVIAVVEAQSAYVPGPYLFRAKALAQLEDYEGAIEDLKNALTYAQNAPQLQPEINNTRAEVYMKLDAYQAALPDLQAATKIDRINPQYQFNLGKTLVKLGGAEPGEKALTKYLNSDIAAEEDEQRAEALQLRGAANGLLKNEEQAAADFAASLEIDPTNHETYFARGQLALGNQDFVSAIEDLGLSIENYTPKDENDTNPFIQAHLARATAFEEYGKQGTSPEEAFDAFARGRAECELLLSQLPETDPQLSPAIAATLFRKGVLERLSGDLGPAVKSFSKALQINPILGEAYFRRGICFFYLGEEKLAIRDFEQAASIDFDSPRSNLWEGLAWAQMGDYNESIRAYGESIAVSDRYLPAYVNRGLAHLQQADFSKAVADFNEAIRLDPTNAIHYYRRGKAYALSGESDKAIKSLMNAVAFNQRLAPAYDALADELESQGQADLAAEYRNIAQQLTQPPQQ